MQEGGSKREVVRGEAAPIVKYSREGQKFKFDGGRNDSSVLFLKFKVEEERNLRTKKHLNN